VGSSLTEWYYPGGYVQDVGNLPRSDENLLGWDLLYLFNPDRERLVNATVRIYFEDRPPREFERVAQPWEKLRTPMHLNPWREYVGVNTPYALRVTSDRPVFPHVTRGEYESWDEHNPTAMYGITLYRGPLTDETTWCYAEGFWQDSEEHPWREEEWIHVLNPGDTPADATVTFFLDTGPVERPVGVGAERIALVRVETLGVVPSGTHYGVRVEATVPVVVQQTRRTFEKNGPRTTRSTSGTLAAPWRER
jgi:hypothetical protein